MTGQDIGAVGNLFYPLPPRLSMLLTTIFTQGGSNDLHLLELLPDDDAFVLQEKAEQIMQLDGDHRAAVVVREMRRQIQFAGLVGLEAIDPSWLLAGVRGEQPHTIAIILAQLSASARSRILQQLPPEVRNRIPPREKLKNVRSEIMRIVRQKFESRFVTMPAPPGEPTNFYFKDIALLDARELVQLIRALGIEQLAAAFLTIGKRKLAELCHVLGRHAAEELIGAVKETDDRDAMGITDANDFLSRILLGLDLAAAQAATGPAKEEFQRELFQKAGLFRLAMAVRAERPSFVQQLAQRIPRSHGRLLRNYVYRITENESLDDAKLRRLQDLVLYRVEKLAARGKVSPRYLKYTFCYWGDDEEAEGEGEA
ncbi:MAG: hypothetical protein AAF449_03275 [Myxococcota bacterium]